MTKFFHYVIKIHPFLEKSSRFCKQKDKA